MTSIRRDSLPNSTRATVHGLAVDPHGPAVCVIVEALA